MPKRTNPEVWKWNTKVHPMGMILVDTEGQLHLFTGNDIPGVVEVLGDVENAPYLIRCSSSAGVLKKGWAGILSAKTWTELFGRIDTYPRLFSHHMHSLSITYDRSLIKEVIKTHSPSAYETLESRSTVAIGSSLTTHIVVFETHRDREQMVTVINGILINPEMSEIPAEPRNGEAWRVSVQVELSEKFYARVILHERLDLNTAFLPIGEDVEGHVFIAQNGRSYYFNGKSIAGIVTNTGETPKGEAKVYFSDDVTYYHNNRYWEEETNWEEALKAVQLIAPHANPKSLESLIRTWWPEIAIQFDRNTPMADELITVTFERSPDNKAIAHFGDMLLTQSDQNILTAKYGETWQVILFPKTSPSDVNTDVFLIKKIGLFHWEWHSYSKKLNAKSRVLIVPKNGEVYLFEGHNIPGVVIVDAVAGGHHECSSPLGTKIYILFENIGKDTFWPVNSWEQAFSNARSYAPHINKAALCTAIRAHWSKDAARFDDYEVDR